MNPSVYCLIWLAAVLSAIASGHLIIRYAEPDECREPGCVLPSHEHPAHSDGQDSWVYE